MVVLNFLSKSYERKVPVRYSHEFRNLKAKDRSNQTLGIRIHLSPMTNVESDIAKFVLVYYYYYYYLYFVITIWREWEAAAWSWGSWSSSPSTMITILTTIKSQRQRFIFYRFINFVKTSLYRIVLFVMKTGEACTRKNCQSRKCQLKCFL